MSLNNTWTWLTPFLAVSYTQSFLHESYQNIGHEKPDVKSYQNSYAFIYYLEHGKKHYTLAKQAPKELQPMLLYYGLTQFIKACLLTVDPDYPKTTAVLAHGVSTRKRKKRGYAFLEDEIKVQKHGLAAHFSSTLFHVEQLEGKKFKMRSLIQRIPDLNDLLFKLTGKASFFLAEKSEGGVIVPAKILDDLHMTFSRFNNFLHSTCHYMERAEQMNNDIHILFSKPLRSFRTDPLQSCLEKKFYLPSRREMYHPLPEILVHFLLLYNLSMISRYETEWWSELFHHAATNDLPLINRFLDVTVQKTPLLIGCFLTQ